MKAEEILYYGISALSGINFMIAMLAIVLISACFLGRYIVITRKMVISTFGVICIQWILFGIVQFYYSSKYPDLYNYIRSLSVFDKVPQESSFYEGYMIYSFVNSLLLNGTLFLYAFFFYFVSNKEKRFLRAVESTICLYLYYY